MTPFVLLGRKKLPSEGAPSSDHTYDVLKQLWIDSSTGMPLVLRIQGHAQRSQYGETTLTETREGADQTEGTAFLTTQFGETTITATREGADQSEGTVFQTSQFGETTLTKTREGADQTESIDFLLASQFGETVHTRTREGVDQTEGTALQGSPFGETTLTNTPEGVHQMEGSADMRCNAPHSHF